MDEEMNGDVRAIAIEDGIAPALLCGLEGCECPDHEFVYPAGVYLTIRLDGDNPPITGAHFGPVTIVWPSPADLERSDG